MTGAPLLFSWDGEVMRPRHPALADKQFVVGENYRLEVREDRSQASHNHYFAAVHESWANLPEHLAERFPTSEHLRKYALVKGGFRDERSIVAGSKAEAQRLAAFIRPMDEFAIVTVSEAVVTVYTAKSQSLKAMGRAEFGRSKEAVLGILADMIGVSAPELQRNAGLAA